MRRIVLAAALLALAAVLVVPFLRPAGGRDRPPVAAPGGAAGAGAPETVLPPAPEATHAPGDERTPAATAAAETAAPPVDGPTAPTGPDGTRRLRGTIVVVDEQGTEHAAEDGRFRLELSTDLALGSARRSTASVVTDTRQVQVRGGAWSEEVSASCTELRVDRLVLGGRVALPEQGLDAKVPVPADGVVLVRARWVPVTLLHVLDRASRRELDPVEALDVSGWPGPHRHPGPGERSVESRGPSPIRWAVREGPWAAVDGPWAARAGPWSGGVVTLLVASPGYAWSPVDLDPGSGGERFVLLDPGGELEVRIEGDPGPGSVHVRLCDGAGGLVDDSDLQLPSMTWTRLAPGAYRVRAELGSPLVPRAVLGEVLGMVVAGARTSLVLAVAPPQEVAGVVVGGTVRMPAEWGFAEFSLTLDDPDPDPTSDVAEVRSSEMTAVGGSGELFAWSLPDVVPGAYELRILATGFGMDLEVGAAGEHGVHVEVPPPCDVEVRCVDADTGEPVERMQLLWGTRVADRPPPVAIGASPVRGEPGTWSFRTRAGAVSVLAMSGGFLYEAATLDAVVRPGENRLTLSIPRLCAVELALYDGETRVPWSRTAEPRLLRTDGSSAEVKLRRGGVTLTVSVEEPGFYTLELPELDGFAPVPPAPVEIERGVVRVHAIALRRR